MRIVIADDERDTLMTLGVLLRSEGFEVFLAQNGEHAARIVREVEPHAVLLDLGMPGRSGYAIANELTREYGGRCPILVAVTAHTREPQRRLAALSGIRHHVTKPYDPDALLKLLVSLKPASAR